jgi:uncharacterized protein (DUF1778 family)
VSFRVSQEEYDTLKKASASKGARSVSDFTRSVACQTVPEEAAKIEEVISELNRSMAKLDSGIQLLIERSDSK